MHTRKTSHQMTASEDETLVLQWKVDAANFFSVSSQQRRYPLRGSFRPIQLEETSLSPQQRRAFYTFVTTGEKGRSAPKRWSSWPTFLGTNGRSLSRIDLYSKLHHHAVSELNMVGTLFALPRDARLTGPSETYLSGVLVEIGFRAGVRSFPILFLGNFSTVFRRSTQSRKGAMSCPPPPLSPLLTRPKFPSRGRSSKRTVHIYLADTADKRRLRPRRWVIAGR